jgi:mannose-6-phosphate isomerase
LGQVAESWELCCRDDGNSIVSSGALVGISLRRLIVMYQDKLMGVKTYQKFGTNFPLLIKIIDANENLSVQVHPDDAYAMANGEKNGKNELWYILDARKDAEIVYGIKQDETKESFIKAVSDNSIEKTLNMVEADTGDAFFVPAGKVHAILGGILIAEIQQNSNTTYRIYDWGRADKDGRGRTLQASEALDVIDFKSKNQRELCPRTTDNKDYRTDTILRSEYFNMDKIIIHSCYISTAVDSFLVLMCIKGSGVVSYDGGTCGIILGETVLFPACIGAFTINGDMTLLSVYMQ